MQKRIVVALALVAAASACQKKAEGQAVAVVNDEEVTAAELNNELRIANIPSSANKDEARAAVLQRIIARKLLVQQAKADELDKSPEFLTQQRRLTDNLLINMLLSRQLNTAQLPSAAEISKFEASRPGMFAQRQIWTLDQLLYATPQNPAVLQKIGEAGSLAELQQVLSSSGIKFQKGSRRIDTAEFPANVFTRVNALPSGMPFIVPGGAQTVANVIVSRQPAPRTGQEARPLVLEAMRRAQAEKVLEDRVKAARASAEIEYQPGYEPKKK